MTITQDRLTELKLHANAIRQGIIESLVAAGSGHSAGSLDMADVFAALYFDVMRHDPKNPEWSERDRLLLSAGHICPVRYSAMAEAGFFPREELLTLRKFGTRLQGHPERVLLPGAESTSGPLGEGLAQSAGLALAAKMDRKDWRVYCVVSDAEEQCGLHWEAMLCAAKFALDNLCCIVDRNFIQIDGSTESVMPLEPLRAKYEAFNWHVVDCDGHDFPALLAAFAEAAATKGKPTVILANTMPGKGVRFMENDFLWHGKPPDRDQADTALAELSDERRHLEADAERPHLEADAR
jgi:transketolase